jgi:hypothetical protein
MMKQIIQKGFEDIKDSLFNQVMIKMGHVIIEEEKGKQMKGSIMFMQNHLMLKVKRKIPYKMFIENDDGKVKREKKIRKRRVLRKGRK